ncbi:MAG: DUF2809 domain-containing protein [Ginsengibacter sp.]
MKNVFIHFKKKYFAIVLLIFFAEIFIALYVHDNIVRPYISDFLVVILIYCFIKSFLNISVWPLAISVLLFSYAVETSQYFNIIAKLGLKHSKLARIIIGTSFEWIDMIAYTAGIALVVFIETVYSNKAKKEQIENTT